MARRRNVLLGLTVLCASNMCAAANAQVIVGTCGPEICKQDATGEWVNLTRDGQVKDVPVISPDGMTVAFSAICDPSIAVAKIGFVPITGGTPKYYLFAPNVDNIAYGFHYLTDILWISRNRIAAGANEDPTTTQYFLFDKDTGPTGLDVVDQGDSLSFSPDGLHFTYRDNHPHFDLSPTDNSRLMTDTAEIIPPQGFSFDFDVTPAWSLDSSQVAAVVNDKRGNAMAFTWSNSGGMAVSARPIQPNQTISISAIPHGFVFHARSPEGGRDLFWDGKAGSVLSQISTTTNADLPETIADFNLSQLSETSLVIRHKLPGNDPDRTVKNLDIWCTDCPFRALPRRVPRG